MTRVPSTAEASFKPDPKIPPWSSADGEQSLHPVDMEPPVSPEEKGRGAKDWGWVDEWIAVVDSPANTDAQGWFYAPRVVDLLAADPNWVKGKVDWDHGWKQAARRRRWQRKFKVSFPATAPPSPTLTAEAAPAPPAPAPVVLPFPPHLRLPIRKAKEVLPFESLAGDVRQLLGAVAVLNKAATQYLGVKGKDSSELRSWAGRWIGETEARVDALEACVRFNSCSSNAAAAGTGTTATAAAAGAGAGKSLLLSNAATSLSAAPVTASTSGSSIESKKRWARLVDDVKALRASLDAEASKFARAAPPPLLSAPVPLAAPAARFSGSPAATTAVTTAVTAERRRSDPRLSFNKSSNDNSYQQQQQQNQMMMMAQMKPLSEPLPSQATLQANLDFTEALVEERSKHIDEITGEVNQVAELFKDLRGLVVEQGEMLSKVEKHVEDAKENTSKGVDHLRQADKLHEKAEGPCVIM